MVVAYSVLNVTIQTFIQPRIVGNSVGLSAEITFMSLVVWTFLLGALGALLAVPMTLLLRAIFIDADSRASWVAPLIDAQGRGRETRRRPRAWRLTPPRRHDWLRFGTVTLERETAGCTTSVPA